MWLAGLVTFSLRRSIPRVAVVLAIPTIPALAFSAFGWGSAIGVWMLGALTGIISTLSSSARTALAAIATLSVAAGLGVANNGNPWGAMLIMGTVAGLSGLVSARGLQSAVSMVPIGAAFIVTQPPVVMMNASAEGNATAVALLIACSAGWGMLVTWTVMRTIHFPAVDPTPPGHARILAIMLTFVVGGAAWFVQGAATRKAKRILQRQDGAMRPGFQGEGKQRQIKPRRQPVRAKLIPDQAAVNAPRQRLIQAHQPANAGGFAQKSAQHTKADAVHAGTAERRVAVDHAAMGFQQGIGTNIEPRHRGVVRRAGLSKEKTVHACSGPKYLTFYTH